MKKWLRCLCSHEILLLVMGFGSVGLYWSNADPLRLLKIAFVLPCVVLMTLCVGWFFSLLR